MWAAFRKISASKSKTFLAFCFCFIAGASLASLGEITADQAIYLYVALFGLLFFVIIFWKNNFYRFVLLAIFFFALGTYRFALTIPNCGNSGQVCFYNDKKVTLTGWVSDEPDIRIVEARYTIAVRNICEGIACKAASGYVLIKTRLYPEYQYGDELKIECMLQKPENKDDSTFRYDKYLARYGISSVCGNAKSVVVIAKDSGNMVMKKILSFKSLTNDRVNKLWPEPESSFMAGILYGSKSGLPPELADNFNRTGVTHIIAVSGFNITIIATTLMSVLIALGLWRRQAFWGVITSIVLFTAFTGFSSSAVRAAVMGIIVLTGQYLGRLSRIGNVLVFTAVAMVLANPYVLMWDAGFQLSFLATLGLVYISPVINSVIARREARPTWLRRSVATPRRAKQSHGQSASLASTTGSVSKGIATLVSLARNDMLVQPFISTFSAIIATLPLILYQFGRLSIVAPLVNVLVLWIIPWLMLFGFIALVLGFLFFPLGQLVAWFAGFGLRYVILVVNFFGNQSWSAAEFRLPWWGMVLIYILLTHLIYKATHSRGSLALGERDKG